MEQNKDQSGTVIAWMLPDEIGGLLEAAKSESATRHYGRVYAKQYDPDMVPVCGAAVRGEAVAIMGAPSSVEEKAFNAFWYGHMLEELMQPPLCSIDYSTAKYIWNSARAADAHSEPSEIEALRTALDEERIGNAALRHVIEKYSINTENQTIKPSDFKNFHYSLCKRFGYTHDKRFWWRDLVSLEEHIAACLKSRAADALDSQPTEIVAYLHQVVSGDGEPDQALSFAPDNFPLSGTLGYRSVSHQALVLASSQPTDGGVRNG